MRHLVGWVSLAVCMYGLNADLIPYLRPPMEEFPVPNCTFPFIYNEVTYHSCISVHSDYDWCSLDYYFQGRWRYCKAFGESPIKILQCVPFLSNLEKSTFMNAPRKATF
ncbi:binder of sperm protein homolog 2-like isoform X2 [Peromyscus maniculatus bairdii]|uniref:binder of sperm protein homolog 2-like isoform X2 n=1 Tax=Peromyscus maniculatus bairdii TaxID=230844 RepID=UPI003FD5832C